MVGYCLERENERDQNEEDPNERDATINGWFQTWTN